MADLKSEYEPLKRDKCWCEYPYHQRNQDVVSVRNFKNISIAEWDILYCPVCKKEMKR